MSSFTFTAPRFSLEDEIAERNALSDAERNRLEDDLNGPGEYTFQETPDVVKRSVSLVEEAISSMPQSEKSAFCQALERVPELVERESPCIAFLRRDNFDPWNAAKRRVEYWRVRLWIFGSELAFLPMTLSGAMAQDVDLLERGVMYLPEDDAHGRPVFFLDRIRVSCKHATRDQVLRCLFYMLQVLTNESTATKRGFIFLVNVRGYDVAEHFDRMISKKSFPIIRCSAARIAALHICVGEGKSAAALVRPVFAAMAGKEIRQRFLWQTGSIRDMRLQFADYGLAESHVQVVFGGFPHNSNRGRQWVQERRDQERQYDTGRPAIRGVNLALPNA